MIPKVAVIYLSYNVRQFLDEVLSAWQAIDYPRAAWEIFIVDNASPDGSAELIREKILPLAGSSLPAVTFFANPTNTGFAAGNNQAIQLAMARGFDYVYLENNDAKLAPAALTAAVALAESDQKIGAVQSLILLWQNPTIINVSGGVVQFFGFGFARDNGQPLAQLHHHDGEEIAYASGAAVLYRLSALREVGLLEPFFFMYHEDLELGWRLRLAGYRNVLSTQSRALHYYEFQRSVTKFFWMERNRFLVLLSRLRWSSLLILSPGLLVMEIGLWPFALLGGWWREKLKVYQALCSPACRRFIVDQRKITRALRRVSDREIVRLWSAKIEHQATSNFVVERIGNPLLSLVWRIVKKII